MDSLTRKQFEERLFREVQQLLAVGDQNYLQSLSHTALLKALENELRFIGLYEHRDKETPTIIHTILEQHLDQWLTYYKEGVMSDEQQLTQESPVEITPSPFVQRITTASSGLSKTEIKNNFDIGISIPCRESPFIKFCPAA